MSTGDRSRQVRSPTFKTEHGRFELGVGRYYVFPTPALPAKPMLEVPARSFKRIGISKIGSTTKAGAGQNRAPSESELGGALFVAIDDPCNRYSIEIPLSNPPGHACMYSVPIRPLPHRPSKS